jgi:hypothetical protein
MIKLIAFDGRLCTPLSVVADDLRDLFTSDPVLLVEHDGGDYDSVKWPHPNHEHLRSALYRSRETGVIPSGTLKVELPNGETFTIDA